MVLADLVRAYYFLQCGRGFTLLSLMVESSIMVEAVNFWFSQSTFEHYLGMNILRFRTLVVAVGYCILCCYFQWVKEPLTRVHWEQWIKWWLFAVSGI